MANTYSESTLTPPVGLHHHGADSSQLEQKIWGHLHRSKNKEIKVRMRRVTFHGRNTAQGQRKFAEG